MDSTFRRDSLQAWPFHIVNHFLGALCFITDARGPSITEFCQPTGGTQQVCFVLLFVEVGVAKDGIQDTTDL